MTDTPPPGAVQLSPSMLFQMIGELYAENYMRKINANQDLQADGSGLERAVTTPAPNLAVPNGQMPSQVSRQTGER